ncbi:glycosyltransferase family protein [Thermodesulfobacteriota bacterium]
MKIIQYCQHVLGVGHLFRSLEICRALSTHQVILVTGGPPVETDLPEHVREFRLPDLQMDHAFKGLFSTAKNLTVDQVKEERQKRLLALFEMERPDLFLVELYPFGRKAFRFELDPVLEALREKRLAPCGVFSSVRDILVEKDDNGKHEARVVKTLNRNFDRVLVHADSDLVEIRETFGRFDEISIPVDYTGYIAPKPSEDARQRIRKQMDMGASEALIVASAGGGNVGAPLLEAVIRAFARLEKGNCRLQVFTGPFLSTRDFDGLKKMAPARVQVDKFTTDFISCLAAADLSVSMGGYNTTMNILATRVPALLWPFSQNREQRLRARRLADRGVLTVLQDADLQPDRLAAMMDQKLSHSARPAVTIDLDGAANTARAIENWAG